VTASKPCVSSTYETGCCVIPDCIADSLHLFNRLETANVIRFVRQAQSLGVTKEALTALFFAFPNRPKFLAALAANNDREVLAAQAAADIAAAAEAEEVAQRSAQRTRLRGQRLSLANAKAPADTMTLFSTGGSGGEPALSLSAAGEVA
jgi:poly-gamma-glutamate capsule biosynthesis protein CapA/YwtB (metallophosphatase superfamily)